MRATWCTLSPSPLAACLNCRAPIAASIGGVCGHWRKRSANRIGKANRSAGHSLRGGGNCNLRCCRLCALEVDAVLIRRDGGRSAALAAMAAANFV